MREIHKDRKILVLPYIAPDDALTIQGFCAHSVDLFADCPHCEAPDLDPWELTIDCPICHQRTYFVFPAGELLVCEKCHNRPSLGGLIVGSLLSLPFWFLIFAWVMR